MYMIDQGWWFVPNSLNKFTGSSRKNLKANPDGSITPRRSSMGRGSFLPSRAAERRRESSWTTPTDDCPRQWRWRSRRLYIVGLNLTWWF
jgi:hypothetical protein